MSSDHPALSIVIFASAIVACSASAPAVGDFAPHHAFGGVARVPLQTVRDDLLVPQAHTGPGLGLGLRYAGALGPGVLRADAGFGMTFLSGQHRARGVNLGYGLRLRYPVALSEGDWHLGLGPALGWESDVAYLWIWDDSHAYFESDRWLGPSLTAWTRLSRCWRVDLEAELLLLGVQSRPTRRPDYKQDGLDDLGFYFERPTSHPRLSWIGDTQRARLAATLWRSLSDTDVASGWGLGAEARLVRATFPEQFLVLELAIHFTTAWGFP